MTFNLFSWRSLGHGSIITFFPFKKMFGPSDCISTYAFCLYVFFHNPFKANLQELLFSNVFWYVKMKKKLDVFFFHRAKMIFPPSSFSCVFFYILQGRLMVKFTCVKEEEVVEEEGDVECCSEGLLQKSIHTLLLACCSNRQGSFFFNSSILNHSGSRGCQWHLQY